MKKIFFCLILVFVVSLSFGNFVFAQDQAALPKAGITPESPFYFLDKLGEALRQFFTFNPEGKARLQIAFAAERVAEIKVILETKGVEAKGLSVAQSRLQEHLANVATIVTKQKSKGKDVSTLAKELDDKLEKPKSELIQSFKEQKEALKLKKEELKAKIREARQVGDSVKVETLTKELEDIKTQKDILESKKDEQKKMLEQEEEKIEKELKDKEQARKALEKKEGIKVRAETVGKKSFVKIEKEFSAKAKERAALIAEIIEEFKLTAENTETLLKIKESEDEELGKERLRVKAEVEENETEVEIKMRFIAEVTERPALVAEIVRRSQLSVAEIEKVFEFKNEDLKDAEEAIKEAEEEKQEVLNKASKKGIELPPNAFTKFDRLLAQAKKLFAKENFQGAEQLAKQAEDSLDDVEKEIKKLEKEKEKKENQVKKEEKRKQEEDERKKEKQVKKEQDRQAVESSSADEGKKISDNQIQPQKSCVSNYNPFFTTDITDLSRISKINAPVMIQNSGAVKSHSYLWINGGGEVPVYAPVDSQLTAGSHFEVDYGLIFTVSCEVTFRFGHITRPIDAILSLLPNTPQSDSRDIYITPINFKAGDLIGYTSGTSQAHNWDFGVYNNARLNSLSLSQPGVSQKDITANCPFDYYQSEKRSNYYGRIQDPSNASLLLKLCNS